MKFLLECVILEISEKTFRNKEGKDQAYYVAQAYQPGVGVAEFPTTESVLNDEKFVPGELGVYTVEFRNNRFRITDVVK